MGKKKANRSNKSPQARQKSAERGASKSAKRQTNKNHGTVRKAGGQHGG